jgi:hypothetical protein
MSFAASQSACELDATSDAIDEGHPDFFFLVRSDTDFGPSQCV